MVRRAFTWSLIIFVAMVAAATTTGFALPLVQRVTALIASTPTLRMTPSATSGDPSRRMPYVSIMANGKFRCCSLPGGFLNPQNLKDGRLPDGREVIIVPLDSATSGGIVDALIFASVGGRVQYIAHFNADMGHLGVELSGNGLQVETPVYSRDDAHCCPSHLKERTFSIVGNRVVKLREWIRSAPSQM
jgi:hypothetical protein